jgi:hypothetical protein
VVAALHPGGYVEHRERQRGLLARSVWPVTEQPIPREDASLRIFEGEYSSSMWNAINSARTIHDLREALYLVCCRLQELEARLEPR